MRRHLFVRIMNVVEEHDDYFVQKMNAAGTLGLSCLQKVATAFKMIASRVAVDATDDYVRVGENIALKCLRSFVVDVVKVFGPEYLRLPNEHDTVKLLAVLRVEIFWVCWVPLIACIGAGKLSYSMAWDVPGT
jgi:hypothetical protein